jgi:RNA polymerase sigma-70 factor, ECF subfamily
MLESLIAHEKAVLEPARGAAVTPTSGFSAVTKLDDSPETLTQTRLAVARAKEGDRDAIRLLYVRYSGNVYGYVRSIVHDEHDAEDVTQHVFAKLITVIQKYDERGIPFFAWLMRIARNAAIDHLRANRTTPVECVLDPDGAASTAEAPMVFREALDALPQDQREVMLLRHLIGLSPSEVAEHLGRTEASVHGLQHRGRRTLQRELTRMGATPSTRRRAPEPKARA